MKSNHAIVGALIRKELKEVFPGVKFSVFGCTAAGARDGIVYVYWKFGSGPAYEEVDALTRKYVKGSNSGGPFVHSVSCNTRHS